jgi:hypothetical protein
MKVFVVKSDYSEVPLVEVREEGGIIDFVVDNTSGRIPAKVGRSYQQLLQYVGKSSHLSIEEPKKATVNLLRYVMSNGDVVELTSDGHTCVLNGQLLSQEEKDALFDSFRRGEIKVARKTDVQEALPVLPSNRLQPRREMKHEINPQVMDMIENDQRTKDKERMMASRQYDSEIDDAPLHEAEDKDWVKDFFRYLKYGDQDER